MSLTSRHLVTALRALALLLIGLHLAAPWLNEPLAWGLWPATYVPPGWRWSLAGLAICLVLFGDRLPAIAWQNEWAPRGVALTASASAMILFYSLRIVHTRWGDAFILVNSIPHPDVRLTYSWQAPLDIFVHAQLWRLGHALWGWSDAMPAYWVLSSLAGGLFIWILLSLADLLGRDRTEKLILLGLVLTLGTMQLFFGYIEAYTLMTAGVLIYTWLAVRALRGQVHPLWPALALALTHAFHPSTLILIPSLLYLTWVKRRDGAKFGLAGVAGAYLLVAAGTVGLMSAGGNGLTSLLGAEAPGGGDHNWFVPLSTAATRWEHYTMFSLAHLLDLANQQLLSAPVVLPALLLLISLGWARVAACWKGSETEAALDARVIRFLALMTIGYLLLVSTWNPDYGGQRDWDLFSPAALPAALLLGYLLPRVLPERRGLLAAGWALIGAQGLHTAAWIYQNTQPWFWS